MKTLRTRTLLALALVVVGISEAFATGTGYVDSTQLATIQSNILADVTNLSGTAWSIKYVVVGILIAMGLFSKFMQRSGR